MFNDASNTRADQGSKYLINIDLKLNLHMHILNYVRVRSKKYIQLIIGK